MRILNTLFDNDFIAHVRERDGEIQSVLKHLLEVAELSKRFSSKINLPLSGRLIGLAHDLGKYSDEFQRYIRGTSGMRGPIEQEICLERKGKIDHATAGAQKIWEMLEPQKGIALFAAQILSTCVAYHHGGLPDYVDGKSQSPFLKRISKSRDESFVDEVLIKGDEDIIQQLNEILSSPKILEEVKLRLIQIHKCEKHECLYQFHIGLLTRFLFSCLIDADRLSAANFENPKAAAFRSNTVLTDWQNLGHSLENHLFSFIKKSNVNDLRNTISNLCLEASSSPKGIFTLDVPTGGGKTLASLRFALNHAKHHSTLDPSSGFERIIYVIPYTSIIEQNAETVRNILGDENILEHHSNLIQDNDTWRNRVLSENWDAPVVFTTSVQFLNTLFSGSTNDVRRMHQLSNAIIIFDEIQTLPIKTIHLFNNAINFLTQTCGSSVVLCTATQPLLDRVREDRGAIRLNANSAIISDDHRLFEKLRRTQIKDYCKDDGWTVQQVADLSISQMNEKRSVLIIVNTKKSALELYKKLYGTSNAKIFHLSTNMCPAHRKATLDAIRGCLLPESKQRIICISTQLIEAGVDIDFGAVIRYLAGLDSIAQAAGRCNRNGLQNNGPASVFIVNPIEENIDSLIDIRKGQEITRRILNDFRNNPATMDNDLLSPNAMRLFYKYYFFDRAEEMIYPIFAKKGSEIGCDTDLLDLLSVNEKFVSTYGRTEGKGPQFNLRQAFRTAGSNFEVIDAPTQGIIVPYEDEGKRVINELASAFISPECSLKKQSHLLRQAQQYSVNIFPGDLKKLLTNDCIYEVQKGSEIFYLDERHYDTTFGVSIEESIHMTFLNV